MKFKSLLICLWVLLISAPALAQQSVVAKYRSQYPTPMSSAQILALEKAVASEVHGGLLRKPDGNSCGGFACDIICFSDAQLFDILGDAEGAGNPQWSATTNPRGYHCELQAPAPPVDEHHAESDENLRQTLAELAPRLSALEVRLSQLEAKLAQTSTPPPPPTSDVSADVKRIRELLELVAKRFGLQ